MASAKLPQGATRASCLSARGQAFSRDFGLARRMQVGSSAMTPAEELAQVDAEWDHVSPEPPEPPKPPEPPASVGAFGHASERRLGLRVPATCWVLVKDGERGVYARMVELSPTGTVLKLLDAAETRFDNPRRFELDIFIPGATAPIHAVAWPARAIGQLEAFEFLTMSSSDRLTLAEYLDRLVAARPSPPVVADEPKASAPPVSWRNFVLSLQSKAASDVGSARRAPPRSNGRAA